MASIISAGTTSGTSLNLSGDTSGVLQLASNGSTTAVTIDTSQNVGIGTSSPATKLNIGFTGADAVNTFRIEGSNGSSERYAFDIQADGANTATKFLIGSGGGAPTERMRINSSGQLIVGATSTVFTNDTTGGSFQGSQTGGGKPILEVINTSTSSSADGCPAIIAAKGSSTTTSSARFIQFSASSAAQPMGGIVGNGATNCQFASISDAREKTNIQEISGSLEKINALKPVEFDWIRDNSHVNAGFVAQDVQQVFPEFVVNNMSDEGQEQRYGLTGGMTGGIIAHLVKAIQELNAKVDAQAVRIAELEGAR
jgi:hypothetical protein